MECPSCGRKNLTGSPRCPFCGYVMFHPKNTAGKLSLFLSRELFLGRFRLTYLEAWMILNVNLCFFGFLINLFLLASGISPIVWFPCATAVLLLPYTVAKSVLRGKSIFITLRRSAFLLCSFLLFSDVIVTVAKHGWEKQVFILLSGYVAPVLSAVLSVAALCLLLGKRIPNRTFICTAIFSCLFSGAPLLLSPFGDMSMLSVILCVSGLAVSLLIFANYLLAILVATPSQNPPGR